MIANQKSLRLTTVVAVTASAAIGLAQSAQRLPKQSEAPVWLQPKVPTLIEWVTLELQASEGDSEYGEDGIIVAYYQCPQNVKGVVCCDLEYLSSVSAELLVMREDGLRRRFESLRVQNPWATLQLRRVARRLAP